jgi:hypothetical protein
MDRWPGITVMIGHRGNRIMSNKGEHMNSDRVNSDGGVSLRGAAIIAGVGLLLMAVIAPYANFGVLENLIVPGDANSTATNIIGSQMLFRVGMGCFLIVAILDIVVAWALYVLFRPVHTSLSLLAACFRIVYAAVLAAILTNLLSASQVLSGAGYLGVLEADQVRAQAMLSLDAFGSGWDIALAIFGLHLLVLGYLVFESAYFPRFMGVLVVIAGLGYLMDGFGSVLVPGYSLEVSRFTFVGEALLIFWLLWRGIRGMDERQQAGNERNPPSFSAPQSEKREQVHLGSEGEKS